MVTWIGRDGRQRQIVGEIAAAHMMGAGQAGKPQSGIVRGLEFDAFETRARDVLILLAEEGDQVQTDLPALSAPGTGREISDRCSW